MSLRILSLRFLAIFASAAALAIPGWGQAPAGAAFDSVTIKVNPNCGSIRGGGTGAVPGILNLTCTPLRNLIRSAYGAFADNGTMSVTQLDVVGGPAWLDSQLFDLDGRAPESTPVYRMVGTMLRTVLEQQWKLRVHREKREVPVFTLEAVNGSAKLHPAEPDGCKPLDPGHLPERVAPGQPQDVPCGFPSGHGNAISTTLDGHGMTIAEFAGRMLVGLGRPVVDKTGIAGRFDIHLEYATDVSAGTAQARGTESGAPSIFTAVRDQLGLTLTPEKGFVEVLVVDSVERPSE